MRSLLVEGSRRSPISGFSLLELTITIVLLGAALLLALPKLSIFEDIAFRSDARRVAGLIKQVDDSAASGKYYYRLTFEIGGSRIEAMSSADGRSFALPQGIPGRISLGRGTEVVRITQSGARESGAAGIIFYPGSGAQAFEITLMRGEQACTIAYNPYSGRVKIV